MTTPDRDDDEVLTGEEAADHLRETWNDRGLGQGKVGAEVIGPWLIIDRDNGGYRAFISLADDTIVTILDPDATTRHVPKELRPEDDVNNGVMGLLGQAFESASGGMYPATDADSFQIGYRTEDGHEYLNIGLTTERVWVTDA